VDFVHVDTVLLRRISALIAVEHGCGRTPPVGLAAHPTPTWTAQGARNLVMDLTDRATCDHVSVPEPRLSVHQGLCGLRRRGIQILSSPPGASRANAICEQLMGTLCRELHDRIRIVNQRHLRRILTVYRDHFDEARPHRALAHLAPAQTQTQTTTSDQPGRGGVQRLTAGKLFVSGLVSARLGLKLGFHRLCTLGS